MTKTLIAEHGQKELHSVEMRDPSGNLHTFYEGSVFLRLPDNSSRKTPEAPTFKTIAEGEAWLAA